VRVARLNPREVSRRLRGLTAGTACCESYAFIG
jgi:hypothetical protein